MTKILCTGDSLTQGSDIEPAYTWTTLLGNHLGVPVINTGIGGDTTAGILSRFPLDLSHHQPDIVLIMGGTNDLWWGLDLQLIIANISAMVHQARHHDIAAVIGLPLPICVEDAGNQDWEPPPKGYAHLYSRIRALSGALEKCAGQWEVPVADYHRLFVDESGNINPAMLLQDGVHASRSGHRAMAGCAGRVLKDLFYFS